MLVRIINCTAVTAAYTWIQSHKHRSTAVHRAKTSKRIVSSVQCSKHPQDDTTRELRSDNAINDTRQQEQTQPVERKAISRSTTRTKKAFLSFHSWRRVNKDRITSVNPIFQRTNDCRFITGQDLVTIVFHVPWFLRLLRLHHGKLPYVHGFSSCNDYTGRNHSATTSVLAFTRVENLRKWETAKSVKWHSYPSF